MVMPKNINVNRIKVVYVYIYIHMSVYKYVCSVGYLRLVYDDNDDTR